MRIRAGIVSALAAAAALHGCSCDQVPKDALTSCDLSTVAQGAVKTDILFIVDDSGSMAPHQANLAANLSLFIDRLSTSPVANDFQIGVTTTSVADSNGNLTGEQGCFVGPVLAGDWTDPVLDLVGQFRAQVDVGINGSGKEQPLRAMKLALTTPSLAGCTRNTGFLRPGARLAVVILTDEDDNSETSSNVANTNNKTHNDAGDGVDYKFMTEAEPPPAGEDRVADYISFLRGLNREVVVGVIAGVDPTTLSPTVGYAHVLGAGTSLNHWGCENPAFTCGVNACGDQSFTLPVSPPNLTMDVYCCGDAAGVCSSTCTDAYDKPDRLVAFTSRLTWGRTLVGSICGSFASTLDDLAGLIVSPTVPLEGAPADYRMMVVRLRKAATGAVVSCSVGLAAGVDAIYAPPSGDVPATLTFEVAAPGDGDVCKLDRGDQILIDVVCAG